MTVGAGDPAFSSTQSSSIPPPPQMPSMSVAQKERRQNSARFNPNTDTELQKLPLLKGTGRSSTEFTNIIIPV